MWVCTRRVLSKCGWVDEGRVVADGDPMLEGCEDAFQRVAEDSSPVEQATAAPGEKRNTGRSRG